MSEYNATHVPDDDCIVYDNSGDDSSGTRITENHISKSYSHVSVRTNSHGYEEWRTRIGDERPHVYVHRLLAVAECGMDSVKGKVVHHENGVPWDNRPDNISIMTRGEHTRVHS